ncbi:MAG: hypothetical protein PHZ00_07180 [Candidatus Peribacteraceae bacterium]|nr:hypothetical protein [Candidatus Peribacteraceae bacterium]
MSLLKKKQPAASCSVGCVITKWIVAVLLFVAVVMAAIGIVQTHVVVDANGSFQAVQFGSSAGSLAIIAFSVALLGWVKQMTGCLGKCDVCSLK